MKKSESIVEWRPVKNYEGIYEINNLGVVKSLSRKKYCGHKNSKPQLTKEKYLKNKIDRLGYVRVKLSKDGKSSLKYVHRILALSFIDNPKNKKEINHIDGNKQNNNLNNLEWTTRSKNMKHAFELGLHKAKKGEENNKAKLTKNEVKEIRRLYKKGEYTQTRLGEMFDVSSANINEIVNNKTWKEVI